jgi:hypothetical protein
LVRLAEVPCEIGAPVTEADDCDSDWVHAVARRCLRIANGVLKSSRRS